MQSRAVLLNQQLAWASSCGLTPDSKGYLPNLEHNFFQPLSPSARAGFTGGSGSEFRAGRRRPAKITALHSSAALVVNVFDYWSGESMDVVASALAINTIPESFEFEAQFPTGLVGLPPNLDLAFRYRDGKVLGLESKFSEWLTPKNPRKEQFKPKYFPSGVALWKQKGLINAQALATAVRRDEERFRHLDVPQLLKHMLGLASNHRGNASLYYIFYDCPGRESSVHLSEIERFAKLIGDDMPFHWASYQDVYGRFKAALGTEHDRYIRYLEERYFRNAH